MNEVRQSSYLAQRLRIAETKGYLVTGGPWSFGPQWYARCLDLQRPFIVVERINQVSRVRFDLNVVDRYIPPPLRTILSDVFQACGAHDPSIGDDEGEVTVAAFLGERIAEVLVALFELPETLVDSNRSQSDA